MIKICGFCNQPIRQDGKCPCYVDYYEQSYKLIKDNSSELAKAIERIDRIGNMVWRANINDVKQLLAAAKRSQELQKKLDEWSNKELLGETEHCRLQALEQSSREKDEKLTKLELHLAFWSAAFSKYLSFEANGIKYIPIKQIVADFNKCDQFLNQQKEK